MRAEDLFCSVNPNDLLNVEGVTARVSNDTMAVLWQGTAQVVNSIKADGLEELARELRRRPTLRGVPPTVDARELEARAKALRGASDVADQ